MGQLAITVIHSNQCELFPIVSMIFFRVVAFYGLAAYKSFLAVLHVHSRVKRKIELSSIIAKSPRPRVAGKTSPVTYVLKGKSYLVMDIRSQVNQQPQAKHQDSDQRDPTPRNTNCKFRNRLSLRFTTL